MRGGTFNGTTDVECTNTQGQPDPGAVTEISTAITFPANGGVVDGGQVTISGNSEAPGGISRVRLTVVRRSTGEYLNADGSYTAAWAPLDIDLNTNNETSPWSIDVNLEFVGTYDILARTFDNNGVRDSTVARSFVVGAAANEPPEITVESPTFVPTPGNNVVVSGIATDDVGVSSVNFLVRNRDTQLYFRPDGTIGAAQSFTATLSDPGATETDWTRTLNNIPTGEWQATVDAFDTSGQRDRTTRTFSITGNVAPPSIELATGGDQKIEPNGRATFTGSAEAEASIERIEVLVRDVIDRSGVEANGAVGARALYFPIPLTNGGTQRDWSYTTPSNLPVGTYDVFVRVVDEIGTNDIVRTQLFVGPIGDDLPTTTFDAEGRFEQSVNSLNHTITGTAADDNGVSQVTITVFDDVNNDWLAPDGSTSITPVPHFATLSNPGGTSTDWTFTFDAPFAGTYFFRVRAVDSAGQAAANQIFGSLLAYPGDVAPEVVLNSPTEGQNFTGGRIFATGSATDDNELDRVEVRIRNRDTLEYLQENGSFGGSVWIEASLTNPGADRTNWDYTTPSLPDGEWQFQVRSVDLNDQTSSVTTRIVNVN